jgi:type I restriction enzyme S subunit
MERRIAHDEGNTHTYKVVHAGDYVISLRSFQGGLEYSEHRGAVSPAYHVIYPTVQIAASFYRHYFKSADFIGRLATAVIGIRDGKQVNFQDFGLLRLPFPDIATQKRIGVVLDTCDEEIHLLRAKRSAIDQQKRGLMQRLLTGRVRVKISRGGKYG